MQVPQATEMSALQRLYSQVESPLNRFEIRLLCVDSRLNTLKLVNCTLYRASLKNDDEYEALSYRWDSSSNSKSITVDGQEVRIMANLESALRHLRRTNGSRLLWCDALCINQQDSDERSR